jgi:FAD/FMN-containing dehydrogenase
MERRMPEPTDHVKGRVLKPGDAGFDAAATTWNARFASTPDLVIQCADVDDVALGVKLGRERDLPITVKGAGHDYAGRSACPGGLLLDLSLLQAVAVDPAGRRARVGGGTTWGRFDAEAQEFGLAAPGPTVSTIGVGGSTLGGGEGWLTRKHGLTLDALRSAEVVTADGERLTASPDENPDLFWALRGGGGNFGIATSLEFELYEVGPELLAGQIIYPATEARDLFHAYRDFCDDLPREAACFLFFLRIPPIPDFPERFHGQLAVDFVVSYAGPTQEAEEVVAPLRRLGEPIVDTVAVQSYVALQQSFDAGLPTGNRWYSRAHYLDALPDAAIDAFVSNLEPFPGAFTIAYLGASGGAVSDVGPAETAFPHRNAAQGMHVLTGWTDPADDETVMEWGRRLHGAMEPYRSGVYVNLLGEDEASRVPDAYGDNYARLGELKQKWDPDNVFRSNHNIPPTG